jgi:hypothetical protein
MLMLSLGTPYVVRPSDMVDAMGHEQWEEWQAFDQIYPVAHTQRMIGLISQMAAQYLHKATDTESITMPWTIQDAPETAADRDAATAAVMSAAPSALRGGVTTSTAEEYIL